jgi:hypothetical protein
MGTKLLDSIRGNVRPGKSYSIYGLVYKIMQLIETK